MYWRCSEIPSDESPEGTNWQYLCDEELDALFTLQATQVDPAERQATFHKITKLIFDKVYWLGLWQDPDLWAFGPRLRQDLGRDPLLQHHGVGHDAVTLLAGVTWQGRADALPGTRNYTNTAAGA